MGTPPYVCVCVCVGCMSVCPSVSVSCVCVCVCVCLFDPRGVTPPREYGVRVGLGVCERSPKRPGSAPGRSCFMEHSRRGPLTP